MGKVGLASNQGVARGERWKGSEAARLERLEGSDVVIWKSWGAWGRVVTRLGSGKGLQVVRWQAEKEWEGS